MILVASVAKLLTLGFTVAFSALLLLCVRWKELHAACVLADTCDLSEVRLPVPCLRPQQPKLLYPGQLPSLHCSCCVCAGSSSMQPACWLTPATCQRYNSLVSSNMLSCHELCRPDPLGSLWYLAIGRSCVSFARRSMSDLHRG